MKRLPNHVTACRPRVHKNVASRHIEHHWTASILQYDFMRSIFCCTSIWCVLANVRKYSKFNKFQHIVKSQMTLWQPVVSPLHSASDQQCQNHLSIAMRLCHAQIFLEFILGSFEWHKIDDKHPAVCQQTASSSSSSRSSHDALQVAKAGVQSSETLMLI